MLVDLTDRDIEILDSAIYMGIIEGAVGEPSNDNNVKELLEKLGIKNNIKYMNL